MILVVSHICRNCVVIKIAHPQVSECSSEPAGKVEDEKPLRSPHVFQHAAKHPQGKHVGENMHEASMHEHVGDQLVGLEIIRSKKMKSERANQVHVHRALKHIRGG